MGGVNRLFCSFELDRAWRLSLCRLISPSRYRPSLDAGLPFAPPRRPAPGGYTSAGPANGPQIA